MSRIDARAAMVQLHALAAADDFADAAELNKLLVRAGAPIGDRVLAERLETDAHMAFLCLHVFPPSGIPTEVLDAELAESLAAIESAWRW